MILRRTGLKPLCRQCGHEFDQPAARCPACGTRSGLAVPLRRALRPRIDEPLFDQAPLEADEIDAPGEDEITLAPPIDRPPPEPVSIEMRLGRDDILESRDESPPVARNVSLRSLMLGVTLVAVCLGIGRASTVAGIVTFLVLIPAYIRTLSAISYYRERERKLEGRVIAEVFATSLVLALMGLLAGGLVFLVITFISGLIVDGLGWEDPIWVSTTLSTTGAFVTVLVLVHRVWPVNEE